MSKEQLIKTIEGLPPDLIEEVQDFIAFIQKRRESKSGEGGSWGDFSLSTGAFDFWNDPEEVEYSLDDLKKRT
jgi:hypothetical protein